MVKEKLCFDQFVPDNTYSLCGLAYAYFIKTFERNRNVLIIAPLSRYLYSTINNWKSHAINIASLYRSRVYIHQQQTSSRFRRWASADCQLHNEIFCCFRWQRYIISHLVDFSVSVILWHISNIYNSYVLLEGGGGQTATTVLSRYFTDARWRPYDIATSGRLWC